MLHLELERSKVKALKSELANTQAAALTTGRSDSDKPCVNDKPCDSDTDKLQ